MRCALLGMSLGPAQHNTALGRCKGQDRQARFIPLPTIACQAGGPTGAVFVSAQMPQG